MQSLKRRRCCNCLGFQRFRQITYNDVPVNGICDAIVSRLLSPLSNPLVENFPTCVLCHLLLLETSLKDYGGINFRDARYGPIWRVPCNVPTYGVLILLPVFRQVLRTTCTSRPSSTLTLDASCPLAARTWYTSRYIRPECHTLGSLLACFFSAGNYWFRWFLLRNFLVHRDVTSVSFIFYSFMKFFPRLGRFKCFSGRDKTRIGT